MTHPAVAGRETELRSLADAVRRLVDATVTNVAPAEETAALAAEIDALADRLAVHVPDPLPPRYAVAAAEDAPAPERHPFDLVLGPYNPLALPVEMDADGDKVVARARFTTPYEGPPGCVHGAVIASTFDMVFAAANHIAGVPGPTVRLTVRYRRPTPLHRDLVFEAWTVGTEGRRITAEGRILHDGEVTAEAEGLFVLLDRDDIMRLSQRGTQA